MLTKLSMCKCVKDPTIQTKCAVGFTRLFAYNKEIGLLGQAKSLR
jgi:hypothetical protein